ncbi:hypothetical protein AC1031_009905 [Aphanomyces cochlioides]|nr:hypothetical protein AC1031_009905 [Aphanomyces cochlioides]
MPHSLCDGAYGQVWLGKYMTNRVVIKKLLPKKATTIECPYIVHFIGVAWTKPSFDMMFVTEYMDRGDLCSVLQSKENFPWTAKLQCALHIAEGLSYLHTLDPKIIHRDLKSRNVLLDSKQGAKIADIGIARKAEDLATMTMNKGTYRWMAPGVLKDDHYSESADLLSFGVILAELDAENPSLLGLEGPQWLPLRRLVSDARGDGRAFVAVIFTRPPFLVSQPRSGLSRP